MHCHYHWLTRKTAFDVHFNVIPLSHLLLRFHIAIQSVSLTFWLSCFLPRVPMSSIFIGFRQFFSSRASTKLSLTIELDLYFYKTCYSNSCHIWREINLMFNSICTIHTKSSNKWLESNSNIWQHIRCASSLYKKQC